MKADLEQSVILITGAARGIGAAVARNLAARGAQLILTDVLDCQPLADALTAAGSQVSAYQLDVRDKTACADVVGQTIAEQGRLTGLVCNAGVCPPGEPVGSDEQWRAVMEVNVYGSRNCVDAVWESMKAQGGGTIVLNSSMAYYQGGLIVGTEYSASKAALIGMTRHLARNGGPLGIRCNAVAPGIIETPMTEGFAKPDLEKIPLRRLGSADDVAGPISFLCGPESAYMTGTVLNVTGGMVLAG